MTEERPTMTEEQETPAGKRTTTGDLLQELQALGRQLGDAFTALWQSEESRHVRQEIKEGFVELSQELDQAIKSAQESEAAKEFSRQVKETVDRAREGELVEKVEAGLAEGLRKLNQELSKATRSVETGQGEPQDDETEV
jgi:soluble cytochrome b562